MNGAILYPVLRNNKLLEISVYNLITNKYVTFHARQPNYTSETKFLSGEVKSADLGALVKQCVNIVKFLYTDSENNATILRKLLCRDIFALTEFGMPPLEDLLPLKNALCYRHAAVSESNQNCAEVRVKQLYIWAVTNTSQCNLADSAARLKTFEKCQQNDVNCELLAQSGYIYRNSLPLDDEEYQQPFFVCTGCSFSCTKPLLEHPALDHMASHIACPFNTSNKF